eukprot:292739-Rhodomonas_salina.2
MNEPGGREGLGGREANVTERQLIELSIRSLVNRDKSKFSLQDHTVIVRDLSGSRTPQGWSKALTHKWI